MKCQATKANRSRKIVVCWCLNEACSLYGEECYEPVCTRCEKAPTSLVWSVVLCEPRGIYMGLVEWPRDEMPKALRVFCCRSCVLYRGIGSAGLASVGPGTDSRITGALDETLLANPKSLHAVTPEALARWEDEPWSRQ